MRKLSIVEGVIWVEIPTNGNSAETSVAVHNSRKRTITRDDQDGQRLFVSECDSETLCASDLLLKSLDLYEEKLENKSNLIATEVFDCFHSIYLILGYLISKSDKSNGSADAQ